jgi:hypothetical protein
MVHLGSPLPVFVKVQPLGGVPMAPSSKFTTSAIALPPIANTHSAPMTGALFMADPHFFRPSHCWSDIRITALLAA